MAHFTEKLIEQGYLTREKLLEAQSLQKSTPGEPLEKILISKSYITKEQLIACLTDQNFSRPSSLPPQQSTNPPGTVFPDLPRSQVSAMPKSNRSNPGEQPKSSVPSSVVPQKSERSDEDGQNELSDQPIDRAIVKMIDRDTAVKFNIMPVSLVDGELTIAMLDPNDVKAKLELKKLNFSKIKVIETSKKQLHKWHETYYRSKGKATQVAKAEAKLTEELGLAEFKRHLSDQNVPRFVRVILQSAINLGASDIHFDCFEQKMLIRYRMDGTLQPVISMSAANYNQITSRMKIMANLDITEKRKPQDGRVRIKAMDDREVDFRVSILPTLTSEKIVLRILDKSGSLVTVEKLGFNPQSLALVNKNLTKTAGLIIVTGPTGSGKTTTLYSMLQELNDLTKNIITIEDPVEYSFEGLSQAQINDEVGLTFAESLRSALRQDPDVIMVGEVRDEETAGVCVRAALTGHLVLSTAHTNDAASAAVRLIDMKVKPYLVASALALVIAQRLIRKICTNCKVKSVPDRSLLLSYGLTNQLIDTMTFYEGKGCSHCSYSGYKGRMPIFEVLNISGKVQDIIASGASSVEVRREAIASGMIPLYKAALQLVNTGLTSWEEARVFFFN